MSVVVCTWGEERTGLAPGAAEVLTLGHKLSEALGCGLDWLTLGAVPAGTAEAAAAFGVANLQQIEDPKLEGVPADIAVAAIEQYFGQASPSVILFNQNAASRVIAPRVAGRLGGAVVMNAVDLGVEGGNLQVTATAYGGDTRAVYELAGGGTSIVAINANAVTAVSPGLGASPASAKISVDLSAVVDRIKVVEAAKSEGPRLEDAEIIVAGGRGLGAVENYKLIRELADAMGGMAGASRPLVDEGWVDSSHQVGLTEKDHQARALRGGRHLWRESAHGRLRRLAGDRSDQQGRGRGNLPPRALRCDRGCAGDRSGADSRREVLRLQPRAAAAGAREAHTRSVRDSKEITSMSSPESVLSAEGLFADTPAGPRLLGSRCASCSTPYFPRTTGCHHPDCDHAQIQDAEFGPRGTLWTVTIQSYAPPAPVICPEPYVPYAVGVIDLDDGLRVVGRIRTDDPASVEVGAKVELVLDSLGKDENGADVISWQFDIV